MPPLIFPFRAYRLWLVLLKLSLATPFIWFTTTVVWRYLVVWRYFADTSSGTAALIISVAATLLILAICIWSAWEEWRGWLFTRHQSQFIRFDETSLAFFVYPQDEGTIPYTQIHHAEIYYKLGRGGIYDGELVLEYGNQIICLNLRYLRHPTLRFWHITSQPLYECALDDLGKALSERCGFYVFQTRAS